VTAGARVSAFLRIAAVAVWALACAFPSAAPAAAPPRDAAAAVATAHPLATAAGLEMLERGGNAFDAACAAAAVLAVVEPYASGLGGGGFFLLHRARDRYEVMVDARETAPAAVTRDWYLDREGKPIRGATTQGGTASGIPGVPAALAHVARRYGALPLAATLAPAIRHARDGHAVDERYARIAGLRERYLQERPAAARIFLDDGRAPKAGWVLRQPELAATLERLAKEGAAGFYGGAVGRALVESVNRAGGGWRAADLAGYRVVERPALKFQFRGATVTTAVLPSAGGIALAQSLQMLERLGVQDPRAPRDAHLAIEALRRAFHDRALHLGDSDFVRAPVERLVSRAYAAQLAASISADTATRSDALGPEVPAAAGASTTHLSIVDAAGNRVAATLTINLLFGSGVIAEGTGVLLNNEMDDFSLRDDLPNAFRLRGGSANAVAPGKRPLSSMTPTFVEDGKGVLVLGAPGGSRIVSQVLLAVLDYLRAPEVDLAAIVAAPRYHHQWWPDRVEVEPGAFPAEWRAALESRGHRLQAGKRRWGNMQAVFKARHTGAAHAASDPRGSELGWY
jgi:gamma-glutamyltranspeptidase/glutathione hydrolase